MSERLAHIQIVGWNHGPYLSACIRSCLEQTHLVPILYVDNASSDGSADQVARDFPTVQVVRNTTNRGYAGGHNDGLRAQPETEIAILLNPDIILDSRFVEELLKPLSDSRVGAVVPLLLRGSRQEVSAHPDERIDSYGTVLTPSLRAVHQFENEPVSTAYSLSARSATHSVAGGLPTASVWGFTGAAVALSRKALLDVAIDREVFSESLFSYREDVDLSWRLLHREWNIVGAPSARAIHERQVKRGAKKSRWARQLSWANAFLVLVRNVPARLFWRHAPFVIAESVARVAQAIVTPTLWPAVPRFFRALPDALRARNSILRPKHS